MKFKLLSIAVMLCLGNQLLIAQASFRGGDLDERLERLEKALDLSTEQLDQIKEIYDETKITPEQRQSLTKEERKARFEERQEAISEVLSEEQKAKFESLKQNRSRKHIHNPEERMRKIAEELELSDEQKSKFEEVRTMSQEQIKTIRMDSSLDKDAKKAKIKEVSKATSAELKTFLSNEQFEKWQELKSEFNSNRKQK